MDTVLDCISRRQHGLLTTSQLQRAGWSEAAIRHAAKTGRIIPYPDRRGVFRMPGAPPSLEQAWMAAVLASDEAVVAHLSATKAWGLRYFPEPDAIDLLRQRDRPRLPGVRGHDTIWLPPTDCTRLRLVPITTAERTFVDACGYTGRLAESGDDALRRDVIVLPRLVRCYEAIPVSGRRKSRPMRQFFAERVPGYDPGGSAEELDVGRTIRRAGLRPPVQQFRIDVEGYTYFADYAYPDTKHLLEYQGHFVHGQYVSALHADSERTRRLQRAGYTVWPITKATSANEIIAIAQLALGHEQAP